MLNMWGFTPETWDRIQQRLPISVDPEALAEATARREAENKIEESGEGECSYCKEDIVKNERGFWESEFLIEYCIDARDHRHKPKIVWNVTGFNNE